MTLTNAIDRFSGEHEFLSNFYRHPQMVCLPHPTTRGVRTAAASGEHAYQASKTLIIAEQQQVLACYTPGQAKKAGRLVTMRPHWDEIKVTVMTHVLEEKFSDRVLALRLLATHPRPLVEGNTWGDTFWGVCYGKGDNNLGFLLMALRERLRRAEGTCHWCGHPHDGGPENCEEAERAHTARVP